MNSYEKNIHTLKKEFSSLTTKEDIYKKILTLGAQLKPLDDKKKIPENLVPGCQSIMYLASFEKEGKIYFEADSDALISKGIAYLLLQTYNGLTPEEILQNAPTFLHEIGIYTSLSLNRSNGLSQILLRMKKDAVHFLTFS